MKSFEDASQSRWDRLEDLKAATQTTPTNTTAIAYVIHDAISGLAMPTGFFGKAPYADAVDNRLHAHTDNHNIRAFMYGIIPLLEYDVNLLITETCCVVCICGVIGVSIEAFLDNVRFFCVDWRW